MLSNKIESVFSNCKYGDHTSLLTKNEYDQLKVFGMLNEFNRIYSTLIKQNANYKKKDALWAIYNDLRLKFEYKKDFE